MVSTHNFLDFLTEALQLKYTSLKDAVNKAPKNLQSTLEKILDAVEPGSEVKLENKSVFMHYNGYKKSATILKMSMENVERLAKLFDTKVINVDKDHPGFYHLVGRTENHPGYLIKVVKTGSTDLEATGSTQTAWQESGVLLYLDNDLKPLENYKPTARLHVGKDERESNTIVEETLAFLERNVNNWNDICLNTARQIAKKVPNYQQYEFHRGSVLFNTIKNKGLKLTGLKRVSSDKWNPSDIFLIKKGVDVLSKIKQMENVVQINQYLAEFDEVIGVSLKKGDTDAAHGAISLDNVVAMQSLGQPLTTSTSLEKNKQSIYNNLKKVHHSAIANLVEITKCSEYNLKQAIDQLNPKSDNFNKSFPPAIEFLTRICADVQHANDVITMAYLTAVSKHPLSCPHYKADGTKIVLIDHDQASDVKLNKIIVPLNGDTNVIFALTVDGKGIKLQLRSKGSKPQFIVLKETVSATGKHLSSFSV